MAVPSPGTAVPRCEQHVLSGGAGQWQAPLSRVVSVQARSITLKQALDKVAHAARMRVSYSAELLPLDREVCITYESVALGNALADLLRGIAVEPVIASADHIVLAPRIAAVDEEIDPQPLVPLAPVVATATPKGVEREPAGYAFTVLDHEIVSQHGSVAQALSAGVPGVWAWQSPAGFTTLYSVRGASSFGVSSPKIYIDGIEVANPLLATQIPTEQIERIEVIRGPQGGALYGGDAISGVTNIVTRHDPSQAGAPRLRVQSGLAFSGSAYSPGAGLGQDHAVALQLGSPVHSGALNLGIGSIGEYMPGAFARQVNMAGNMRLVGARSVITGTARFVNHSAGNPLGLLSDSTWRATSVSMRQYTLGARAAVRQSERITHAVVIGVDGYTLSDLPGDAGVILSPADSVLRAAGNGALRTTARLSSAATLNAGDDIEFAITLAAEHSNLHQEGELSQTTSYDAWTRDAQRAPAPITGARKPTPQAGGTESRTYFEQSRSSNGLSAQFDASAFDRAFLTAALRLERDEINGDPGGATTLPMLAGSYVLLESGSLGVKLRASYGKAIRWPELSSRMGGMSWQHHGAPAVLAPEQQTGFDAGVDINAGPLKLQVTRYDQTASGLIQSVAVAGTATSPGVWLELQNVGEIANRGWEVQGTARHGPLSVAAALALTDSRVLRVADGYTGDLRAGDRMLGVPARVANMSASWLGDGWSTSLSAYRAFDWINYDRAALAQYDNGELLGVQLRDFWQQYQGSTRLRAVFTRDLNRTVTLLLTGDNLLGSQIGEPDNLTIVPGRTVTVGVRASF